MPRSRTRSWATTTAMWLLFVVGCGIGVLLSGLPDLRIYKLLNLIGVIWSIFGLVTLSYLTATTEKFQLAALRYSFFFFAILVIELPIGLMAGRPNEQKKHSFR